MSQIKLSERSIEMSDEILNNVRIVSLPPMAVAAYCVESTTPEDDCRAVINKFVLENNLHKMSRFRYFGFNNPNPTEETTDYGNEFWVTVP
jgi:hypothetical protein